MVPEPVREHIEAALAAAAGDAPSCRWRSSGRSCNAGSQQRVVCPGVPAADTDVPIVYVIFAPARPYGVHLEASSCNGRSAFATCEPDPEGRVVSGLQVLRLAGINGEPLITAL